ncbi:hypothetical protein YPC_2585 [Yersinia pestis biovar Medievalis str. Harbin 35]|uniref:Uncharacterized protein n=5 Tax=Yersinia pestis TaxID=632 RepID=Q8CKY4_YERPE|nr:hypothetical [Yersinia pestis KIM10+]AAS61689.1 hypothetical protein YP_1450 [Yersinia pestis biovar Microtus str. 91001]ABG12826.1 conserved hypothetical protein [Yersinia pestis Antiqua]ABG18745.1 conserved hypothetical protein [Yersinia pestis Nepal516]ABP39802.1 conserved hypothetical protein [Yersinia pestis Pestoides F]ADV99138.1 hypothetical protein YPC_2585 [Yersinia pestis biovar Medievalis str. Harbin 35]EEO81329.1 hypothetical protein YPF_2047 [Yersinia pestis biovar Orientalis 
MAMIGHFMCRKSLNQPFYDGHMNDNHMNDNHGVDTGSALSTALASFPLSRLYPSYFTLPVRWLR